MQTGNHASIPPVFYRPDALPAAQTTASKRLTRVVPDKVVVWGSNQTRHNSKKANKTETESDMMLRKELADVNRLAE